MSDVKEKVLAGMKKPGLASLATITEDGKPWVRYVTTAAGDDLTIRFATFLGSRKVAQIRNNPEVHLAAGVTDLESTDYYLQIQGLASINTDEDVKKSFWMDQFFTYFSGPDDPNYCVCEIKPYRIEVQGMAGSPPDVWTA